MPIRNDRFLIKTKFVFKEKKLGAGKLYLLIQASLCKISTFMYVKLS